VVNYGVQLVDGVTGIPTRASSGSITVTGGNNTVIGGSGSDTLNVTGTSDYLNNATDAQLQGIETVLLTAEDTNGDMTIDASDASPFIDLSAQTSLYQDTGVLGFNIFGSSIADSIIGSQGNDTIAGGAGQDTISLASGGADRVSFGYSDAALGAENTYDIICSATIWMRFARQSG